MDTLGAGILSLIGRLSTQRLTSKRHPSIPRLNLLRISCFLQRCSESTQDGAKSTKRKVICHWVTISQLYRLQFWYLSALGGYFVQFTVVWGHLFVHYPEFKGCLYLYGWKCISSLVKLVGGTWFVCFIEVGRSSEGPLLEVPLYTLVSA